MLSHKYSYSENASKVYKGIDEYIVAKLKETYKIQDVYPVIIDTNVEFEYYDDNIDDNSICISIYRFTKDDISKVSQNKFKTNKYSNVPFYDFAFNGILLNTHTDQYIDYTGNESQPGLYNNQYFSQVAIFKTK